MPTTGFEREMHFAQRDLCASCGDFNESKVRFPLEGKFPRVLETPPFCSFFLLSGRPPWVKSRAVSLSGKL